MKIARGLDGGWIALLAVCGALFVFSHIVGPIARVVDAFPLFNWRLFNMRPTVQSDFELRLVLSGVSGPAIPLRLATGAECTALARQTRDHWKRFENSYWMQQSLGRDIALGRDSAEATFGQFHGVLGCSKNIGFELWRRVLRPADFLVSGALIEERLVARFSSGNLEVVERAK